MAAQKCNFLIVFKNDSQVLGSASKEIAMKTPPPAGTPIEDKRVLFVTYQPDREILSVHLVPMEEVLSAELEYPKKKVKEEDGKEETA